MYLNIYKKTPDLVVLLFCRKLIGRGYTETHYTGHGTRVTTSPNEVRLKSPKHMDSFSKIIKRSKGRLIGVKASYVLGRLWSLVSGLWSLVSDLWSLVSGLWSLISDLWSLVSGLWSLISGF